MSGLLTALEGDMRPQGRVNKNEKIELAIKNPKRVIVVRQPSCRYPGARQVS